MKTSKLALAGLLSAASVFTACGDDVTKVTNETSGMEIVASADSLEKCTSKNAGKTVFVSGENAAYICADSAWKNVSETEKTSCSAEALADSTGFKIVCDGDSVGVVKNGANGEKGDKGESSICTAESLSDGSGFKIVCDGDSVGVVKNGANGTDGKDGENCRLSDNGDGTVKVVCGETSATLYKAFCGGKLFNPDSNLCAGGLIAPLSKKNVWDLMNPEIEYGVFVDKRDDQVYRSVKIGEQTWMAENLNYAMVGSFCPKDKQDSCAKYGRLYTWSVAMDSAGVFGDAGKGCGDEVACEISDTVRGACPRGWHLPSVAERDALVNAVGGGEVAGRALKSGYVWNNNGYGTDSFGFSALPVSYNLIGYYSQAVFWFAAESADKGFASSLILKYNSEASFLGAAGKSEGASVRCVKD